MEKLLGKELNRVSHKIHREIDRQVREMDLDAASRSNLWIIGYILDHKGQDVFQKDLESNFCLNRSTVSKVIDLMIQKGMIRRESVAYDARLKKLIVTDRGMQIHEQMDRASAVFEKKLCRGLSQEDMERFYMYLTKLENNLDELKE